MPPGRESPTEANVAHLGVGTRHEWHGEVKPAERCSPRKCRNLVNTFLSTRIVRKLSGFGKIMRKFTMA